MHIETPSALLRMKSLPRLIFLFGEEEFLLEETASSLVEAARMRGIEQVDIDVLDGEEISAEQLVRRAEAFPMASQERFILVRHFDRVPVGRKNSADYIALAEYIRSPSPTTILVLAASEDSRLDDLKGLAAALSNPKQQAKAVSKIAKLRFPYNLLIEHAAWIEFPRLPERQLPEWIIKRFKSHGYDCPAEVAEYLIVQVGTRLRDLANEAAKLMLYVGERKRLSIEDVLAVAGASRVYNVFELQKAVGQRDLTAALRILHHMVRTERQDLLIVTMLARYFFTLWRIDELRQTTTNATELGRAAGISPFFVPEYLAALRHYTSDHIADALELLHQADVTLKSSSTDTLTVLQQTLLQIMRPKTKAPRQVAGRSV
ncbi:MAG: DNA polymerase III subunit delta [Chlorobi bacterium]|nr:DNA polymerase III subunit delta [Chlorobiota bacterium]